MALIGLPVPGSFDMYYKPAAVAGDGARTTVPSAWHAPGFVAVATQVGESRSGLLLLRSRGELCWRAAV